MGQWNDCRAGAALTGYIFTSWPHAMGDIPQRTAGYFVVALTCLLWLGLRPLPLLAVLLGSVGATVGQRLARAWDRKPA